MLHGGFPSRTRRTLSVPPLRVRQAPTETLSTNCFQARCRTEGAPATCRCCDDAPGSGLSPATTILAAVAYFQTRALKTEVEFHSSRTLVSVRSHARFLVVVLGVGLADGTDLDLESVLSESIRT